MTTRILNTLIISAAIVGHTPAIANQDITTDDVNKTKVKQQIIADEVKKQQSKMATEHMQILGRTDKLRTEAGSATLIDELALDKMEYDDIHRILAQVPGVNIRQEDGYGLRPNIGFRGVTPERSKKINILEDGILIGPAPYSAPAAYYFPSVNLMTSVEVFKGPAAIKYGPNTVAGTLNMTTRVIPESSEGTIDLSYGSNAYSKIHAHWGNSINLGPGQLGFMLEGLSLSADGFKDIDFAEKSLYDEDSGFNKNDVLAKLNYLVSGKLFGEDVDHYIELKLSQSDEDSNETYMGLTDGDFASTPYRRYAVSQVGNMVWEHNQSMLTYSISNQSIMWVNRLYNNTFTRAWQKVNGFNHTTTLQNIIANPAEYEDFYQILTGERDSIAVSEQLIVGTNDRSYYSRGWQSDLSYSTAIFDIEHVIKTGVRVHQDRIDRDHFEQNFKMTQGIMTPIDDTTEFTTVDYEKSNAVSVYFEDTLKLNDLELTAGVRGEMVDSRYQNRQVDATEDWLEKSSTTWLYSLSGFYTLNNNTGIFAGVHQGYVPTSPKQAASIEPEKSVNYELGGRYQKGETKFEAVLFYNDFENLKESCSFSTSASCTNTALLDQEYNGGEVEVSGLELSSGSRVIITDTIDLPWSVTYTYTDSAFKSDFNSTFEMWGDIEKGDPVPYLPNNQFALNVGLETTTWQLSAIIKYTSDMPEAAGDNVSLSGLSTDASTVVDINANYSLPGGHTLYLKIDNILDDVALVSRRPFGARPSKPQQFFVGYKYQF
ncbi:TonB-dependent receptor [Psychrosphaera sp. B3R10]|uniref:TonB-dependent receptor family protein n=1 Tax=unclassified Psychrosphaera TaxID=2641570 RepID=UPI001C08EA7A|nr:MULTISPECIES: TonB-dependent receptor [unclassified Psychrosphaera]MBU2881449.1 TonB-dependent receptor [Psychrosphaera sp. I2R16]MBU2989539.1 TonB-dependent receptor [Psychrosphaera sp. B3R10]